MPGPEGEFQGYPTVAPFLLYINSLQAAHSAANSSDTAKSEMPPTLYHNNHRPSDNLTPL